MTDHNDEEATRLAIQQFMLGGSPKAKPASKQQYDSDNRPISGKKKKKKKGKKGRGGGGGGGSRISGGMTPSTPFKSPSAKNSTPDSSKQFSSNKKKPALPTTISPQQRKEEQRIRNVERQYWRIYRGFFAIVKDEWIDIDDQMQAVVSSIENIRSRLPLETDVLNAIRDEEEWEAQKEWDGYGLGYSTRREHNFALTPEDVHLAMGHDLAQHEKMLKVSRSLLSDLSEAQNALGRKLDDLMQHHLESTSFSDEEVLVIASSSGSAQLLVDEATRVYSQLSQELYRKQCLVQGLFDSVTNDMIQGGDGRIKDVHFDGAENNNVISSKDTASLCCMEWPRGSKFSFVDELRLDKSLRRCESRQGG